MNASSAEGHHSIVSIVWLLNVLQYLDVLSIKKERDKILCGKDIGDGNAEADQDKFIKKSYLQNPIMCRLVWAAFFKKREAIYKIHSLIQIINPYYTQLTTFENTLANFFSW